MKKFKTPLYILAVLALSSIYLASGIVSGAHASNGNRSNNGNGIAGFFASFFGGGPTAVVSNTPSVTAVVQDTPFLVEDFEYPTGALITVGSANGWNPQSTPTPQIQVTSPGLTYTGYDGSGIGNAATVGASGEDDNRPFTTAINSGSVYAAFMINVSSATTTGDYFFHYMPSSTSTSFFAKTFAKKDSASSNYAFGISRNANAGTGAVYTGFSYATGVTHLLVVKYTFNTGTTTDDTVSLYVDPTLGASEPSPTLSATDFSASDLAQIDRIALRQGSASSGSVQIVDGIRVGTTWASVVGSGSGTPTPTPTSTPTPTPTPVQVIVDGGFENIAGNTWPDWTIQTYTIDGDDLVTPICALSGCGSPSTNTHAGSGWVWFGGWPDANQIASFGQTVTIPSGTATLSYYLAVPVIPEPHTAVLKVKIDSTVVQEIDEANIATFDYTQQNIDVTAFADGGSHTVEFDYTDADANPDPGDSFMIDDVSLVVNPGAATPTPTPTVTPTPTPTVTPTPTPTVTPTPTPTVTPTPTPTPTPNLLHHAAVDMDGDGYTDFVQVRGTLPDSFSLSADPNYARIAPAARNFYIRRSIANAAADQSVANVLQSSGGLDWYSLLNQNGNVLANSWGLITDFNVPGDYDGDGKVDVAEWRPAPDGGSVFYVLSSKNPGDVLIYQLGSTNDFPLVGDFDGDKTDDPAVFHCPSTPGQCTFYYIPSSDPAHPTLSQPWGEGDLNTVLPVVGDYNHDGKDDFAVYAKGPEVNVDPGTHAYQGQYKIHYSDGVTPDETIDWGLFQVTDLNGVTIGGDIVVPGDFVGNADADPAVVREDSQRGYQWFILDHSTHEITYTIFGTGVYGDIPTPGDYDGDGKTDVSIWRPVPFGQGNSWFVFAQSGHDNQIGVAAWGTCIQSQPCDVPAASWNVLK